MDVNEKRYMEDIFASTSDPSFTNTISKVAETPL